MDIGVRALKEHLSEYLERAARGEIIVVTDRGEPKAMLGPIPSRFNLEQGVAEKWIRPGSAEAAVPAQRAKANRSTQEVLREDRGD
jgi:prevent-host-death family protein